MIMNKNKKIGNFFETLSLTRNRKGQEEMVGFALIVIIVSIVLLVFLGFFLGNSKNQTTQSFEAENFVISTLQYSTECQNYYGYISVNDLIFMCNSKLTCNDRQDSCEVLNSTLNGILNQSWNVGGGSPIKGYVLNITSNSGLVLPSISKGNITQNSKGTLQPFTKGADSIKVLFNIFY